MTNHELWNEIGNLYSLSGAYQPAIQAYTKASQMSNGWGTPLCNLAMAHAQAGNTQDAISFLRQGVELLPDTEEKAIAYNKLGTLYSQNKKFDQALEAYNQANELFKKLDGGKGFETLFCSSSPTYADDEESINALLETIELNLMGVDFFNSAFSASDTAENIPLPMNLPGDISTYTDGITTQFVETQVNATTTSNVIDEQGSDIELAETSREFVLNLTLEEDISNHVLSVPTDNNTIIASDAEIEILDREIERSKLQLKNNPKSIYAWERLSDFYKSAGQYKSAAEAIQTALSLDPDNQTNHYRLGLIYAVEKREAEAVFEFKTALELDPNYSQAHASLASQYFNMHLDELGELHIEKAIETGFEADSEYNRACLEAIRGNKNGALDLLQVALETKQTFVNWVKADPDLDTIRGEKRFQELLTAYNLDA